MRSTYKTYHTFHPKVTLSPNTEHKKVKVYAGTALVIPKLEATWRSLTNATPVTEICKLLNPQKCLANSRVRLVTCLTDAGYTV